MSHSFLIFGFGYTAKALAPTLVSQGFNVIGTTRTTNELSQDNLNVRLIDFDCPNMEEYIDQSTHLLISIPPTSATSDLVLIKYGSLIKKQSRHIQWLGYLSSTGVYGDQQGKWVDEDNACSPHTPSGIARLKTERAWLSFAEENQIPFHGFRLSGIYGPGRNAIERLLHGKKESVYIKGHVLCRIHVEDIVSTILASIKSPKPLSIYNVSDNEPAAAYIVTNYASALLQREPLPLTPFLDASLSPKEQEFYVNNRRVSNEKIKKELHITLKYPTYREGLTQIWRDDFAPK